MRVVCDSSSLISLCDNCLLWMLKEIAGKTELIITPAVKQEIVDNPLATRRFELRAIQLNKAINDGLVVIFDDKKTVSDLVEEVTAKTGEKCEVKRFTRFELGE